MSQHSIPWHCDTRTVDLSNVVHRLSACPPSGTVRIALLHYASQGPIPAADPDFPPKAERMRMIGRRKQLKSSVMSGSGREVKESTPDHQTAEDLIQLCAVLC